MAMMNDKWKCYYQVGILIRPVVRGPFMSTDRRALISLVIGTCRPVRYNKLHWWIKITQLLACTLDREVWYLCSISLGQLLYYISFFGSIPSSCLSLIWNCRTHFYQWLTITYGRTTVNLTQFELLITSFSLFSNYNSVTFINGWQTYINDYP